LRGGGAGDPRPADENLSNQPLPPGFVYAPQYRQNSNRMNGARQQNPSGNAQQD
jgi:hypothetical protein